MVCSCCNFHNVADRRSRVRDDYPRPRRARLVSWPKLIQKLNPTEITTTGLSSSGLNT
jgi:hypothetical protein